MEQQVMEPALRQEFAKNNFSFDDDSAAEQCAALCSSFGMKPADFVSHWEVFFVNRQFDGGRISSSRMTGFKKFLQDEQKEALLRNQTKTGLHSYTTTDHVDLLFDNDDEELSQQTSPPRSLSAAASKVLGISEELSFDAELALVAPKTPVAKSFGEGPRRRPQDSPVTPFSRRTSKCTIQLQYNAGLSGLLEDRLMTDSNDEDDVLRRLPSIEPYEVEVVSSSSKPGCRFMNDPIENRYLALEKRIMIFADALAASESSKFSDNVAMASQEQVRVVGRICCDGDGHLNDKSILLEGSVEHSGGQRVRLDLRNLPRFSLFPGQVLGVEGHNPSGYCLVASRLIDAIPAVVSSDAVDDRKPPAKRREMSDSKPGMMVALVPHKMSIILAAGPYSANDNLYFEPLAELLAYARRQRPRLLVLMGPFVDSEHPLIKQGLVDRTFKQIFQEEVKTRIEDYCQEVGDGARVLLIPSCRDAHHDYVFPQAPLKMEGFHHVGEQILGLANPSIVRCDEVSLGCCSLDVLRHLSSEETSRTPAGVSSDRMTRIASHIVAQRSFYPLFPPAPGTPLDLSLAPEALAMTEVPDILMIPSDLTPFVKVLSISSQVRSETDSDLSSHVKSEPDSEETLQRIPQENSCSSRLSSLCINPGRLTKGLSGGTFAEILVLPRPGTLSDMSEDFSSLLSTRTKVVIRRI